MSSGERPSRRKEITEPTFTLPCDACGEQTPDPQGCHHGRDLCPTCSDEDACKDCRRERRDDV